ncbi:ATP-dependent endonuclease [Variovorax sp. KK3]|uniref:ATP-dependent nuclease n=1 Tax=Variovorax sp. KK3 TaxID=1855728 RepID=UPI0009FA1B53|nr:AAA family ATPase [Variovorax sp. KK3]
MRQNLKPSELNGLREEQLDFTANRPLSSKINMHPISSIQLKLGTRHQDLLDIDNPAVTVFIGPNNSGKSMLLRELQAFLLMGHASPTLLLNNIKLNTPSTEARLFMVARLLKLEGIPADIDDESSFSITRSSTQYGTSKSDLYMRSGEISNAEFFSLFMRHEILMLDGASRLGLVSQRAVQSYEQAQNNFARLFIDDDMRSKLRTVLFGAFKQHLVIDASSTPGNLILRYCKMPLPSAQIERSLTSDAIRYQASGERLETMSDGVKALTGILVELYAGDPRVLIVDEPEAFLHPSLARLLGSEIARPAAETVADKNVFIATHSANFLMGCVQAGSNVNIVRLTYNNGVATGRILNANKVKTLFRNPLLRSVNAVEALFFDSVIVVEADSDRAFYDEINHRLVASHDPRGISNCLFLRAQNKQTVADIVRPLRALGIPTAGILDIDAYKEGGSVWSKLTTAIGVPASSHQGLSAMRSHVKKAFEAINKDPKRNGGIDILDPAERKGAEDLFDQLGLYGLFVVRRGELESWLPGMSTKSGKSDWVVDIFEKLGEDPSSASYVRPAEGDVWSFIGEIGSWFRNPQRRGM